MVIFMMPAQAKADGIIKDAEAKKTERINEATAQVSRFNSMYQEYIKNPAVTRQRMFYEAMEDVLPANSMTMRTTLFAIFIDCLHSFFGFSLRESRPCHSAGRRLFSGPCPARRSAPAALPPPASR